MMMMFGKNENRYIDITINNIYVLIVDIFLKKTFTIVFGFGFV